MDDTRIDVGEAPRALGIMLQLAAMATARLQGDGPGEAYLRSTVEKSDELLFEQAAAVILADLVVCGADPRGAAFSQSDSRLVEAAELVSLGASGTAYRVLLDGPRPTVERAVDSVAAAWLGFHADARDAAAFGRRACTQYRSAQQ